MDLIHIQSIAEHLMAHRKVHLEREKGGAYAHGCRVAQTALLLRKSLFPADPAHDDVLTVAAWFHDVGKGIEPHNQYGAAIAREALQGACTEQELEQIAAFILSHPSRNPAKNSYSMAEKLLQDADLLDHYGTFTIWMDFLLSAYREKTLLETAFYDDAEWVRHCEASRGALNYELSRTIFDEKISFINQFYQRLRTEARGHYSYCPDSM